MRVVTRNILFYCSGLRVGHCSPYQQALLHIDVLRAPRQQNVSATTASTLPLDVEKTLKWRGAKIIFSAGFSPQLYIYNSGERIIDPGVCWNTPCLMIWDTYIAILICKFCPKLEIAFAQHTMYAGGPQLPLSIHYMQSDHVWYVLLKSAQIRNWIKVTMQPQSRFLRWYTSCQHMYTYNVNNCLHCGILLWVDPVEAMTNYAQVTVLLCWSIYNFAEH